MAEALAASMPPDLELGGNYTIRLIGLDPTSGATVAGINVSALAMLIVNIGDTPTNQLAVGPYMLVPGASG